MSTQLQNSDRKKPASIIEVLEAKASTDSTKPTRYDYWLETRKPLACLIFVMPLLIWYEFGLALHSEAARSGVDRILQATLMPSGLVTAGFVSILSGGILLFLHLRQQDSGRFSFPTVLWMTIESLTLATILFLASDALMLYFDAQRPKPLSGLATMFSDTQQYGKVLTSLGAGIHEEVVFRLLLFAPFLMWLRSKTKNETAAIFLAATLVSVMFALAHCETFNPEAMPFQASTFLFRFFASIFLCVLFRFRGIAIAVGVHAVFDILAIS